MSKLRRFCELCGKSMKLLNKGQRVVADPTRPGKKRSEYFIEFRCMACRKDIKGYAARSRSEVHRLVNADSRKNRDIRIAGSLESSDAT